MSGTQNVTRRVRGRWVVRLKGSHGPAARVNCGLDRLMHMSRPLVISACRSLCEWYKTDKRIAAETVFACIGCGSEWVATEPWTPIDHEGFVPDAVQEERRRGRG
jgi:hypothetical protein